MQDEKKNPDAMNYGGECGTMYILVVAARFAGAAGLARG